MRYNSAQKYTNAIWGGATNIHLQLANVSKINETTKPYNQTTETCPQYICTETQCNNTTKTLP